MARIRIILEDDDEREMKEGGSRVYELGTGLNRLHEIEGALEQFRRQVLPELTAELLAKAQAAEIKDSKKEMD
jgi:hypothetical protein